ncbi:MAG TPA: hypothetical protein DCY07_08610 [Rhodospirillaceae bacterium]|nr:hypothetical protein [Rhodospirillaceae bacterium]
MSQNETLRLWVNWEADLYNEMAQVRRELLAKDTEFARHEYATRFAGRFIGRGLSIHASFYNENPEQTHGPFVVMRRLDDKDKQLVVGVAAHLASDIKKKTSGRDYSDPREGPPALVDLRIKTTKNKDGIEVVTMRYPDGWTTNKALVEAEQIAVLIYKDPDAQLRFGEQNIIKIHDVAHGGLTGKELAAPERGILAEASHPVMRSNTDPR